MDAVSKIANKISTRDEGNISPREPEEAEYSTRHRTHGTKWQRQAGGNFGYLMVRLVKSARGRNTGVCHHMGQLEKVLGLSSRGI